jgi:glycine cleavage system pyridoxal-binding protein P
LAAAAAVQEMLSELQLKSIDELVHKTVPANILREPLNFNETGTLLVLFFFFGVFGRHAGILAC